LLCDKFLKRPENLLVFFGLSVGDPHAVTKIAKDGDFFDENPLFRKLAAYMI
jgi:hypothetical protein